MIYVIVADERVFNKYIASVQIDDLDCIFWKRHIDLFHPEKQFVLAETIVMGCTGSEIIDVYINTFSPLFVEAVEVLACKYDVKAEFLYGDDLVKPKHLYKIYNYLGDAYDKIDKIRSENWANNKYSDSQKVE